MAKPGPKPRKPPSPLKGRRIRVQAVDAEAKVDEWLAERCEISPEHSELGQTLNVDFARWCIAKGYPMPPYGLIPYHLGARGFAKVRSEQGMVRQGIRLLTKP